MSNPKIDNRITYLDIKHDLPNNSTTLFELLDVGGDTPNKYESDTAKWGFTLQTPFCDYYDKILYVSREATYNNGPKKVLIALRWDEKPENRTIIAESEYCDIPAHQNNALYRPYEASTPLLFCPKDEYTNDGKHSTSAYVRIYQHNITGNTIIFGEPIRTLKLWNASYLPDILLRFCISADMRYMVSEAQLASNTSVRYIKVWDIEKVLASDVDDISSDSNPALVYKYVRPAGTVSGGQGIFSDGRFVYHLSGSTVTYLSCITLDGRFCWQRPKIKGSDISVTYEGATSKFEAEGIFWAPWNNHLEMFYFAMNRDSALHSQYFCMSISGGAKLEGQDSIYTVVPSRQVKATDKRFQGDSLWKIRHPEGSSAGTGLTWHWDSDGGYTTDGTTLTPYMVEDLNLAQTPGWYYFGGDETTINRPWNNVGYLHVIQHSFNNWGIVQIAYRRGGSNRIAKRSYAKTEFTNTDSEKWLSWATIDSESTEGENKYHRITNSETPKISTVGCYPTGKPLVIIVAGQSNAVGLSGIPVAGSICVFTGKHFHAGAVEHYSYWNGIESGHNIGDFTCSNPHWVDGIQDPMYPSGNGGFIPAMAQRLAEHRNRPVYVINVARSGSNCCENFIPVKADSATGLIACDINPVSGERDIVITGDYSKHASWAPSGWLRKRAKAIFDAAISSLSGTAGVDYDILGTIWLQGEYDALYAYKTSRNELVRTGFPYTETLESYKNTLTNTLNWLNTNLVVTRNGVTYGGQTFVLNIGYDDNEETCPNVWVNKVNNIIDDVILNYTGTGTVTLLSSALPDTITKTSSLMRSSWHYSQAGYNLLGYTIAERIKEFVTTDSTAALIDRPNWSNILSGKYSDHINILESSIPSNSHGVVAVLRSGREPTEDINGNPCLPGCYLRKWRNTFAVNETYCQQNLAFYFIESQDYRNFSNPAGFELGGYIRDDGQESKYMLNGYFRCTINDAASLGSSSERWSNIYLTHQPNVDSDVRIKENIADIDDSVLQAWEKVNYKVFQRKNAIAEKGENARLHVGVIAQQVQEAFLSEGLDASRYSLFCYDKWDDEYEEKIIIDQKAQYDEEGIEIVPEKTHTEQVLVKKAGDSYSIRYTEALILECASLRKRIQKLENRINQLTNSTN